MITIIKGRVSTGIEPEFFTTRKLEGNKNHG